MAILSGLCSGILLLASLGAGRKIVLNVVAEQNP